MAGLSHTRQLHKAAEPLLQGLPDSVAVYDMSGPLFFAAAERALAALRVVDPGVKVVIIDMGDVSTMDFTAIVALQSLIADLHS
ncbi:MAG: STAS domain-containing protein [Haliea sp.]